MKLISEYKIDSHVSIIEIYNTFRNRDITIPKYEYYLRVYSTDNYKECFCFGGNVLLSKDQLLQMYNNGYFNSYLEDISEV